MALQLPQRYFDGTGIPAVPASGDIQGTSGEARIDPLGSWRGPALLVEKVLNGEMGNQVGGVGHASERREVSPNPRNIT